MGLVKYLFVGGFSLSVANVLFDGRRKEDRLLRYYADGTAAQPVGIQLRKVLAVQRYGSRLRLIETFDKSSDGAFA